MITQEQLSLCLTLRNSKGKERNIKRPIKTLKDLVPAVIFSLNQLKEGLKRKSNKAANSALLRVGERLPQPRDLKDCALILLIALQIVACAPSANSQLTEPTPIIEPTDSDPIEAPSHIISPTPGLTGIPKPVEIQRETPTPHLTTGAVDTRLPKIQSGETLNIGGANWQIMRFSGRDLANQLGGGFVDWTIVTDGQGFVYNLSYFDHQGRYSLILPHAPSDYQIDSERNLALTPDGKTVFFLDIALPGGWDEEKGIAGPSSIPLYSFLTISPQGESRVITIFPNDSIIKGNPDIIATSTGDLALIGLPKTLTLSEGQIVEMVDDGKYILLNPDGSYYQIITRWDEVKEKGQEENLFKPKGVMTIEFENQSVEVPYPPSLIVDQQKIVEYGILDNSVVVGYQMSKDEKTGQSKKLVAAYCSIIFDERKGVKAEWIPTIPLENFAVPDPRISNPDLFDFKNPKAPISQFVNAMKMAGIEVAQEEVTQSITYQQFKNKDGNPFIVATFNLDPNPSKKGETLEGRIPLLIWTKEEGWRSFEIRDGEKFGGPLWGTSVDGSERWQDPGYQKATKRFNIIKALGFSPESLERWKMGDNWVKLAKKEPPSILYTGALFSHYDIPLELKVRDKPTKEEVILSMRNRTKRILNDIKASGQPGIVDVVAEAMWWFNGPGWERSIYYDTFGRDLIAEAFIIAYEEANKMGLTVGKDVHLLYTDYGIEILGPKSNFVYEELKRTKKLIAQRLGIPPDQVPLEIGIEFHIITNRENPANIGGVYAGDLSEEGIKKNIDRFSEIGPVHIVELQVNYSNNPEEVRRILIFVIDVLLRTGEIRSITLYETLRYQNLWYAINNGMFNSDFIPTDLYYSFLGMVLKYRSN